ncbi:MAG: hypothetical protein Q8P62_04600 [Candidatus Peregrinibacteria bacterium]|nr:hypothetical protein [Candidatus Peregrinibacteria bacterium]
MKINDALKISLIISILLISISVAYYFIIFLPNSNKTTDTAGNDLKCNQLYELKKTKYWKEEIGQSGAIFNTDLNTCLAFNIYNGEKDYFAMVLDMSDDTTLMYYNSTPKGYYFEGEEYKKITCEQEYSSFEFIENGKEIKEYGCEKYDLLKKALEKLREYGFTIFGDELL